MIGLTHRVTGICAGACVAACVRPYVVPAPAPVWACVLAVAGALLIAWLAGRAALWPDLDHHNSTATRSMGLISGAVHLFVHRMSCWVFDMSATSRDVSEGDFRGHRGLSHFGISAVVSGLVFGWVSYLLATRWPALALAVVAGLIVALVGSWLLGEVRGLVLALVAGTALWWLVTTTAEEPLRIASELIAPAVGLGVGVSVSVGMLAHSLGDAATKTGVPLLWPIRIRGQRYYPIHVRPQSALLSTGSSEWAELKLRTFSWVVTAFVALAWWPGLYSSLWSLVFG
ncbi:MAG: metal-dependent hydrolase [Candidatus Nanopelagicales bacterium]